MAKTAFIENNLIDKLVRNKRYTDAFPFLANAVSPRRAGCCKSGSVSTDYATIKRNIANLGFSDREILKGMLQVDKVKVVYRVNGVMQTVEF